MAYEGPQSVKHDPGNRVPACTGSCPTGKPPRHGRTSAIGYFQSTLRNIGCELGGHMEFGANGDSTGLAETCERARKLSMHQQYADTTRAG
ncbi:hypothetical protein GB937_007038 [Aspergillus fischeri]|nr:hypothetical protein GB937_007038 [Aspergillus fischeri]